jgi:hypothetical protein
MTGCAPDELQPSIALSGRLPDSLSARLRQRHWFEPSIAHQKTCICGSFVVVLRDQFDPPIMRASLLGRPAPAVCTRPR